MISLGGSGGRSGKAAKELDGGTGCWLAVGRVGVTELSAVDAELIEIKGRIGAVDEAENVGRWKFGITGRGGKLLGATLWLPELMPNKFKGVE